VRTTLTLDDDVAARIEERCRRTGHSFKCVVNDLLRAGLHAASAVQRKPFRVEALSMGMRPGLNLDNVGDLLEQVEGPDYK
jgi:hypothetical protein